MIKTSNQQLGFKCINPNAETQIIRKKRGNRSPSKVNNSTIKHFSDSEVDKISMNSRSMIRMINKIKEDMYEYLNEFKDNSFSNKQLNEFKENSFSNKQLNEFKENSKKWQNEIRKIM
jgi:hypothetical protein